MISRLTKRRILIVGDMILDKYTLGKASRISPEAPVPVIHVQKEDHRPGGAGNVALNVVSMGSEAVLLGRIGLDSTGDLFRSLVADEGVDTTYLVTQINYPTPFKNRIIAGNQQIIRIDHEELIPLPEQLEQKIIDSLPGILKEVSLVAISDYGKGFLSSQFLSALIEEAKRNALPVITDPKGRDFEKYRGTTVIKPNLTEAYAAAQLNPEDPIEMTAEAILKMTQAESLMITRSEEGISLFHRDGTHEHFPVKAKEVKDVTGAGDTVLAMIACSKASGLTLAESCELSNIAAGIAIEKIGCAKVTLNDIAHRLLETDIQGKIIDHEHHFTLLKAIEKTQYPLLLLPEGGASISLLIQTIKKIAKSQRSIIVYLPEKEDALELITILASMQEVQFILTQEDMLPTLLEQISKENIHRLPAYETKSLC